MYNRFFSRSAPPSSSLETAALAPMVDLFTILVVAVLKAGSPEAPADVPEKDFHLPVSTQQSSTRKSIVVDVGQNGIYVDGMRAGSASFWIRSEELLIKDLYENLHIQKGKQLQIRAHSEVPYLLLNKILLTAQQAGYEDIELIAISNSSL